MKIFLSKVLEQVHGDFSHKNLVTLAAMFAPDRELTSYEHPHPKQASYTTVRLGSTHNLGLGQISRLFEPPGGSKKVVAS